MLYRSAILAVGMVVALTITIGAAQAFDDAKYPNFKGQWNRFGGPPRPFNGLPGQLSFDQTKPWGPGQEAPLTPEYRAVLEASMADQANGGIGNYPQALCLAAGMPHMMIGFLPQEYIITPETTYISVGTDLRRIFTDGRPWPKDVEPTYQGYSIGKWIDEDGDGVYDVLEVETRGPFKGPRTYDATGIPLHFDNESTFKERIFVDKKEPAILHDVITVFDHALTRPWTVDKTYRHGTKKYPAWSRETCLEGTAYVTIGKEYYLVSGDGYLMPTTVGQLPPDPKYFPQAQK
jgi:hypothetical protein